MHFVMQRRGIVQLHEAVRDLTVKLNALQQKVPPQQKAPHHLLLLLQTSMEMGHQTYT